MSYNGTVMIEFTETAKSKLQEFMQEQSANESYLRINVTKGENDGPMYNFALEDSLGENDAVVEGNVKALVDKESIPLIQGSSIDYVEGMHRSGFVISNPNFASGCACGGSCGCGG